MYILESDATVSLEENTFQVGVREVVCLSTIFPVPFPLCQHAVSSHKHSNHLHTLPVLANGYPCLPTMPLVVLHLVVRDMYGKIACVPQACISNRLLTSYQCTCRRVPQRGLEVPLILRTTQGSFRF